MSTQIKTAIMLSGRVSANRFVAATGDIYLYRCDDRSGALARRGRHTNYGYSGYFLASVYDGKTWRKLQFNQMVDYSMRSYSQASECGRILHALSTVIMGWRGYTVCYDAARRSFL